MFVRKDFLLLLCQATTPSDPSRVATSRMTLREAFQSTSQLYRNVVADLVLAIIALIGTIVATYLDVLGLGAFLDQPLVVAIYFVATLLLSFPLLFAFMVARQAFSGIVRRIGIRPDDSQLRLAEEMLLHGTWQETQEHSLTVINETGHDLTNCHVMLDEVHWKNFDGQWEKMAGTVFSESFRWNLRRSADGRIDIPNGDRASFALIEHHEYKIFSTSEHRDVVRTDFHLVFHGGHKESIGYGPDIQLRVSIRASDQNHRNIGRVVYLLRIHLLQQHGIPKVNLL